MKKSSNFALIHSMFLFVLFASSAAGAVDIKSDSDIAGSWVLESAAGRLDGSRVPRGETWIFGNGKLEKKGLLMARSGTYDVPPVPYKIESGKLMVEVVGRPGKFNTFELVEKEGDTMVLHEAVEGYLFFKGK